MLPLVTSSTPDFLTLTSNFYLPENRCSGIVATDRFEDYLDYAAEVYPHLWMVLVRGPITTTSRGLEYMLPDEKKVWDAAIQLAWQTIGKVGTERVPLHLYMYI